MYSLSSVSIANFRSCQQVDFPLAAFTPFVGYNNAGKSNVLHAIRWLIAPFALQESDFHDIHKPVSVEGTIKGITEEILDMLDSKHRARVEPLLAEGGILKIKRTMTVPGTAKSSVLP